MAQLAIKGHETRGKEIIKILQMLGASNKRNYTGGYSDNLYILNDKDIDIGYDYDNIYQEKWGTARGFSLPFPTKEILDTFNENFNDLVEKCENYYEGNNV